MEFPSEEWDTNRPRKKLTLDELRGAGVYPKLVPDPEQDLIQKEKSKNERKGLDKSRKQSYIQKIEIRKDIFGRKFVPTIEKICAALYTSDFSADEVYLFSLSFYARNSQETSAAIKDFSDEAMVEKTISIEAVKSKLFLSLSEFERDIISSYLEGAEINSLKEKIEGKNEKVVEKKEKPIKKSKHEISMKRAEDLFLKIESENPALAKKLKPDYDEYVQTYSEMIKEFPDGNFGNADIVKQIPDNIWIFKTVK